MKLYELNIDWSIKSLLGESVLFEARRNPELNRKTTPYEELEKYKNDPDVYISFTFLDKLGINPRSEFNTPLGIYCYPLKELWNSFYHSNKQINVPFREKAPYVWVFKATCNTFDVSDPFTWNDYEKMVSRLRGITGFDPEIMNQLSDMSKQTTKLKTPFGTLWQLTRLLSSNLNNGKKPLLNWNILLRKLGFCAITDKKGTGLIHDNEPIQAVFLTRKTLKPIDRIYNEKHARGVAYDNKRTHNINEEYIEKIIERMEQDPSSIPKILKMSKTFTNRGYFTFFTKLVRSNMNLTNEQVKDIIDQMKRRKGIILHQGLLANFVSFISKKNLDFPEELLDFIENDKSTMFLFADSLHERGRKIPEVLIKAIASDSYYAYRCATEIIKGRFPEGEKAIASEPKFAYEYATFLIKLGIEIPKIIEKGVITASNPEFAYRYAKNVLGGRFPEGEKVIAAESFYAELYARFLKEKGIEVPEIIEKGIASSEYQALIYAEFLKEKGIEVPDIIIKTIASNPAQSVKYAEEVLKGRFPEGEKEIADDSYYAELYAEFLKEKGIEIPETIKAAVKNLF